ncbi:MAG TPA: hypothetical protein VGK01_12595 [Candidatus Angelobacter sp.]|jgi:hypothetical protein
MSMKKSTFAASSLQVNSWKNDRMLQGFASAKLLNHMRLDHSSHDIPVGAKRKSDTIFSALSQKKNQDENFLYRSDVL